MPIKLRPDAQRFVEEQVKAGRYPTPEAVIEAAIAEMQAADAELDDETIAAIREAEAEGDRGEGIDLETFRAQFNKRISER